jgi:hypothetical protein
MSEINMKNMAEIWQPGGARCGHLAINTKNSGPLDKLQAIPRLT